jgi:predicted solute-binding protein
MINFLNAVFEYHKPLAVNSIIKESMKMLNIKKVSSVKEYFGLIQYYYDTKGGMENEES